MSAKFNLNALNALVPAYQRASGKTLPQVLAKFASKLAFALARALSGIAPAKGSIREEMLDALKNKEHGIKLGNRTLKAMAFQYHSVGDVESRRMMFLNGKKGRFTLSDTKKVGGRELNYWALAAMKEIQYREAARFFVSRGSRFGSSVSGVDADSAALTGQLTGRGVAIYSKSRTGASLGDLKMFSDGNTVQFTWGDASNMSAGVASGMTKPRGAVAMREAISQTVEDTLQYRRFEDDFVKSFREEWAR